MSDTAKIGLEAEVEASRIIVNSFLRNHPVFACERDEIISYLNLVKAAVNEIKGDRGEEVNSRLGSVAKKKAIEIIRRHSNGEGRQHKVPLVNFMSNIWEIEYDNWEAKNEREAH